MNMVINNNVTEEIHFSLSKPHATLLLRSLIEYLKILESIRQETSQFYTEVIRLRIRDAYENNDKEEIEAIERDEEQWCDATNIEWQKLRSIRLLRENLHQCIRGKL